VSSYSQIGFADLGRSFYDFCDRGRAPEKGCDNGIPDK